MSNDRWPRSVLDAHGQLESGRCTALGLLDSCLRAIDDPAGEGARSFMTVHRETARAEAARSDAARARGEPLGPLSGIPISIKDLFDEAGHTTTAGSRVLQDRPPAESDAPVVAHLRKAGAIIVGRTNMTEFAYSGVGLNPHFGTPRAPYDRITGRIPGGSTSGGAVSVADGMCWAALGSDTGGSVRIPAAFCGLVGFKPTQGRLPSEGAFPLAPSFDSVGLIAKTVNDCRYLDAAIRGTAAVSSLRRLSEIKFGVAAGLPFEDLETAVGRPVEEIIHRLSGAGARITDASSVDWSEPGRLIARGRVTAVECRVCHGELFKRRTEYDARVAARIEPGETVLAIDYVSAVQAIAEFRAQVQRTVARFDVVVMPTVACVPPPIADLTEDRDYFRINSRVLRNTTIANVLGFCAISLPLQAPGAPPVGLMLMAPGGKDSLLLDTAQAVEDLIGRG
jgi:aspartyl-tRNA(Asn)/glutamyl-tRNA(Gln) amidotransferase subunit A